MEIRKCANDETVVLFRSCQYITHDQEKIVIHNIANDCTEIWTMSTVKRVAYLKGNLCCALYRDPLYAKRLNARKQFKERLFHLLSYTDATVIV